MIDKEKIAVLIIAVLIFGFSKSVLAAWTCQPDYATPDPYGNCSEFSPGVIGIIDLAQETDPIDKGNVTTTLDLENLSSAEKRQLLFKLSDVFALLFK